MLLNIHSPFFLTLEGRQCGQPEDSLSGLPVAWEKWAWDPGLVINELVGNAKLPEELFKKWTDLAGICLCPSSQPPFMPGTRTQCQQEQQPPYDQKDESPCVRARRQREEPGCSVMSLQSCTSLGLPVSKLLDMQEK